jgi:hypothetical protein
LNAVDPWLESNLVLVLTLPLDPCVFLVSKIVFSNATCAATPWQRVPNNVHIPPDIYEKYNHTPTTSGAPGR